MAGTELAELAAAVKSTTAEELQKALQDCSPEERERILAAIAAAEATKHRTGGGYKSEESQ